jgi:hypothetical protein
MLSESGFGQPNSLDTAEQSGVPSRAVESARFGEGIYKMIEKIDIHNFRCFDKAHLQDLKTVNLIVGRNGSGKTAFLEALFFTLGSPGLAFKLRRWRGMSPAIQYSEYVESRLALWRDLFHRLDQNKVVRIEFTGSGDLSRAVEIECEKRQSQIVTGTKKGRTETITTVEPITFRYFKNGKRIATVKPDFSGGEINFRDTPQPAKGSFFPSVVPIDTSETATNFSSLSRRGGLDEVFVALRDPFPMVKGLSLEIGDGLPMVFGEVEGVPEKIPLGLVSTGLTRLVAYLVAIANNTGGIVIIDEIENGFYFDAMPKIWKVLRDFCVRHEVQLFASTHSAECLEAAAEAANGHEEDFSLLRAERKEGSSIIRQFTGTSFRNAMIQDAEVR